MTLRVRPRARRSAVPGNPELHRAGLRNAARPPFPRTVVPAARRLVRRSWTVWVDGEERVEAWLLTKKRSAAYEAYMNHGLVLEARRYARKYGKREDATSSGDGGKTE